MSYDDFARRIVETGVLTDPWLDGVERFREEPVFVSETLARRMARAAEDVAAVYDELCRIVDAEQELLDEFFCLTPFQKAMWIASAPLWHGIARADVFVTDEGLQIAELNCDTPTGEAEAVILNELCAPAHPDARDPNAQLGVRFCEMVDAMREHVLGPGAARTLGLVYPTEFTEDLSLVRLYRRWFEARGFEVVLGSPYNLDSPDDDPASVRVFGHPVSTLVRHYKTDWWGERQSVWDDETLPDARPLEEPIATVFAGVLDRRLVVVNPFGAVLPQNKRAMAFMWEHIHRFSPHAQDVIQRLVPVTARLETLHEEQLRVEQRDWVLKSDYGAEGGEVIVGRHASEEEWQLALAHARPGRWIAQRYFQAEQNERGESVNYGVFLVASEAAGLYARVQVGPTDDHALSVPTLVRA
jgi:glutathionylspermidine synthase